MASEAAHLLANYLHHLSSAARVDSLPDRALLERFASQRDDDAFAALVRRHEPMVLRVCQRVLKDAHAAEDAFQLTFLILSRRQTFFFVARLPVTLCRNHRPDPQRRRG